MKITITYSGDLTGIVRQVALDLSDASVLVPDGVVDLAQKVLAVANQYNLVRTACTGADQVYYDIELDDSNRAGAAGLKKLGGVFYQLPNAAQQLIGLLKPLAKPIKPI